MLAARGSWVSKIWEKVKEQLQDFCTAHGPQWVPIKAFGLWASIKKCLDFNNKGCKLEKVKQAKNEKTLPFAAFPAAERKGEGAGNRAESGAESAGGFSKGNKKPVYQESPDESWEDLDPQDQAELEDKAAKYDKEKYPLVAITRESEQPVETLLSLADQVKMIQGQLIELKVTVDGGNNPWGKDSPFANPSAPPSEEPRMRDPPLQPPVWDMPTGPPPGYVKPGSNSIERSPLQIACEEGSCGGDTTDDFGVFPIVELQGPGRNRLREWRPFQWKQIKELKEACVQYGPIAPFTMAILDALSNDTTPPEDWKHIAHACLSGGDYLLWKSEFYEKCKKQAEQNALRRFPITFDMLAGEGIYSQLRNQLGFAPGAYAQTTAAAKDAWRLLPSTARKEVLYQQAKLNSGSRSGACFTYKKMGHRAAQCPRKGESESSTTPAKKPPDICPKCRKKPPDICKDKKLIQGNWVRGQPQAPNQQCYGALQIPKQTQGQRGSEPLRHPGIHLFL